MLQCIESESADQVGKFINFSQNIFFCDVCLLSLLINLTGPCWIKVISVCLFFLMVVQVFNIDNNNQCFLSTKLAYRNKTGTNKQTHTVILNCTNISQGYSFYCTFYQINAALVSIRTSFKNIKINLNYSKLLTGTGYTQCVSNMNRTINLSLKGFNIIIFIISDTFSAFIDNSVYFKNSKYFW